MRPAGDLPAQTEVPRAAAGDGEAGADGIQRRSAFRPGRTPDKAQQGCSRVCVETVDPADCISAPAQPWVLDPDRDLRTCKADRLLQTERRHLRRLFFYTHFPSHPLRYILCGAQGLRAVQEEITGESAQNQGPELVNSPKNSKMLRQQSRLRYTKQ